MTDDAESLLTRDEKAWLEGLVANLETSEMEYDSEPQRVVIREEEPLSKEERLRRDLNGHG